MNDISAVNMWKSYRSHAGSWWPGWVQWCPWMTCHRVPPSSSWPAVCDIKQIYQNYIMLLTYLLNVVTSDTWWHSSRSYGLSWRWLGQSHWEWCPSQWDHEHVLTYSLPVQSGTQHREQSTSSISIFSHSFKLIVLIFWVWASPVMVRWYVSFGCAHFLFQDGLRSLRKHQVWKLATFSSMFQSSKDAQ